MIIQTPITITIQLYGVFRRYLDGKQAQFSVSSPATLSDIIQGFAVLLKKHHPDFDAQLLTQSVFANDVALLSADEVFEQDTQLSILPPVCGG